MTARENRPHRKAKPGWVGAVVVAFTVCHFCGSPGKLGPAVAYGAPADVKARKAYEKGRDLYAEGRFAEAMNAFLEAYKLRAAPGLLFNAALAANKANELLRAHELVRKFLAVPPTNAAQNAEHVKAKQLLAELEKKLPGLIEVTSEPSGGRVFIDSLSIGAVGTTPYRGEVAKGKHLVVVEVEGYAPARREIVVSAAEKASLRMVLSKNAGTIEVGANVPGAEILLDDKPVGETPLRGVAAAAGDHRVEVRRQGYRRWKGEVKVTVGQTTRVEANLVEVGAPRPTLRLYFWGALAVGGAGTVAGIVFGVLAKSKASDLENAHGQFSMFKDLQSTGKTYSAVAIASFVVGGLGLGTAGVLFLLEPKGEAPEPSGQAEREGSRRTHAWFGPGPGQIGLSGGMSF